MINTPGPYGPLPSDRQLRWRRMEFYGFAHFTVNTFTDKEWGYGDESPRVFNPTTFDADQIACAFRDAGMTGLIVTCKHHDGFCLWPSRYTEHSVRNSPWRGGKGDAVGEIADACRRAGLEFGVYLSPWDRNHKDYARDEYIAYYRNQLTELLTQYGPVFEIWFDGANGGDGYYGGAGEKRKIDPGSYYGWAQTWDLARRLAPEAVLFSDVGPDIRWVGNESGFAGDPCWQTYTPHGRSAAEPPAPGATAYAEAQNGHRDGKLWMPAEVDVSIRPGWFYHPAEDARVRTPGNLMDMYFASVGRGASLLLNVPPDRRGLIHESDAASLRGFRKALDATFGVNLAQGAKASAGSVRLGDAAFAARNVLDGRDETYWCADDDARCPQLTLEMPRPVRFNVVSLREHLPLGQRVDSVTLDCWEGGSWRQFARLAGIGSRRLWRGQAVTTTKVRLTVEQAAACPAITEFALHAEP